MTQTGNAITNCLIFIFIMFGLPYLMIAQTFIHVDQFGYRTEADKVAVISNPQVGYNADLNYQVGTTLNVRRSTSDAIVYSGSPTIWSDGLTHNQSGDQGWWFDFSSIKETGDYYIEDPSTGAQSASFQISDNPYQEIIKAAGRMFYYNRCGTDKPAQYTGENWADVSNFNQDVQCRDIDDPNNTAKEKDLSGGWFDAGDYNKYVTFTHNTLHDLLSAYETNPSAFSDNWNIPESGNNIPDILDEIKWELDWLLKMTNPDGTAHIKMGSRNYSENSSSPPSANTNTRYYGPICSAASASLASTLSHATVVYKEVTDMSAFATTLQSTAIATFNVARAAFNSNSLDTDCDDGRIIAGDADVTAARQLEMLLIAAIYLFELTGDNNYNSFIANNYSVVGPIQNYYWGAYTVPLQTALLTYANNSNANTSVRNTILNRVNAAVDADNDNFFGWKETDLYRGQIPDYSYHWGSNNPKSSYGNLNILMANYNIGDINSMNKQAEELVHYFHGVNPQSIVYLSNMKDYGAERSANEIYHAWFNDGTEYDNALTSAKGPAPGFLSGGPNADFTIGTISPPANQPRQKAYLDFNTGFPDNSWEITEPAIYYQAAYIRLLSNFVSAEITTPTEENHVEVAEDAIELMPNPAEDYFMISGNMNSYDVDILDVSGQIVSTLNNVNSSHRIDISTLGAGAYFIRIKHQENQSLHVQLLIKAN